MAQGASSARRYVVLPSTRAGTEGSLRPALRSFVLGGEGSSCPALPPMAVGFVSACDIIVTGTIRVSMRCRKERLFGSVLLVRAASAPVGMPATKPTTPGTAVAAAAALRSALRCDLDRFGWSVRYVVALSTGGAGVAGAFPSAALRAISASMTFLEWLYSHGLPVHFPCM